MRRCRAEITPGAAVLFPLLYFLDGSGVFSVVLPAVAVHELGHCIAVWGYGGRILSLRLELTGLCLELTPFASPHAEAVCAAAGPVSGLLWAAVCALVPGEWWTRCRTVSLYFSLCNLLPALPLDGGRILYAITGQERLVRASSAAAGIVSFAAGVFLRQWGLLLPAVWILLTALRCGDSPSRAARAGRPAPAKQRESVRSRSG